MAEERAFDRMLLCGRNRRKGEALAAELAASGIHADFLAVDLSCQMEVRSLCSQLRGRPIHCAALLAGVTAVPTREETPDGLELHFGLNYLSRFHLVTALLENFQAAGTEMSPARVLLCGSSRHRGEPVLGFSGLGPALPVGLGDFKDMQLEDTNAYRPWKAFGQAALCNVMLAYELQKRFRDANDHIAAVCFDPGPLMTAWDLYRREENRWPGTGMAQGDKDMLAYFTRVVQDPESAAELPVALATTCSAMPSRTPQVGYTGYWELGLPALSKFPLPWNWSSSYDEELWSTLWDRSERLVQDTLHHSS